MSASNKTRYEVQKILADCLKAGLAALVVEDHGFDVMEFAQASFQKADRIVLMNLVRSNRIGWQGRNYSVENDDLKETEDWIECQRWQFHVILKKLPNPTVDTMQADDVASMLITWFNGRGNEFLRDRGVANERVDSNSLVVYNDDSGLYQKRAVFTVKLQVPKETKVSQNPVGDKESSFIAKGFYGV